MLLQRLRVPATQTAHPEDIEYANVHHEMELSMLEEYRKVERVVAMRFVRRSFAARCATDRQPCAPATPHDRLILLVLLTLPASQGWRLQR